MTGKMVNCNGIAIIRNHKLNYRAYRFLKKEGYIQLYHPAVESCYHPMLSRSGHVFEHRLVMARSLGRCLLKTEIVHHKNGIRSDNRIENLELISSKGEHNCIGIEQTIKLNARIKDLENYIIQLGGIVSA